MIIEGIMDYNEHISEIISVGFISFIITTLLITSIFIYINKKNGNKNYCVDISIKTFISISIITLFSSFVAQIIYYNQEIKNDDLKDLIILEKNFNLLKNDYNHKEVLEIENFLKFIKKDNKITTAEYYVFKNRLDNMIKENIEIKNIIEYNDMKKEFINGGK